MMTPRDELLRMAPIKGHWFHSVEVAPGLWTNGHKTRDIMESELVAWRFPSDLSGKSVLDIGCADGGFSAAALRRGALSVLAIDEQVTTGMRLIQAAKIFPALEFRHIGLFSNEFMELPKFDFIIFAGVLYHVQDMLEALKRVRARATGEVMLETHVNETLGPTPPMAIYYEKGELNNDPTNWWGPNVACLEALFRTAGFTFDQSHIVWENAARGNGRVSYRLRPALGGIFSDVIESATGSNSLLEEARDTVARLFAENAELRAALAARK